MSHPHSLWSPNNDVMEPVPNGRRSAAMAASHAAEEVCRDVWGLCLGDHRPYVPAH